MRKFAYLIKLFEWISIDALNYRIAPPVNDSQEGESITYNEIVSPDMERTLKCPKCKCLSDAIHGLVSLTVDPLVLMVDDEGLRFYHIGFLMLGPGYHIFPL